MRAFTRRFFLDGQFLKGTWRVFDRNLRQVLVGTYTRGRVPARGNPRFPDPFSFSDRLRLALALPQVEFIRQED